MLKINIKIGQAATCAAEFLAPAPNGFHYLYVVHRIGGLERLAVYITS